MTNPEFKNYHNSLKSIIIQVEQNPLIPKTKKDTIIRILAKYAKEKDNV